MAKTKFVLSAPIVAVFFCTGFPPAAMANSGPIYFSAGVLVPTTSNDIRLTREVLTIDYSNQIARKSGSQLGAVDVHARFWFRNEGGAVTQKMGGQDDVRHRSPPFHGPRCESYHRPGTR